MKDMIMSNLLIIILIVVCLCNFIRVQFLEDKLEQIPQTIEVVDIFESEKGTILQLKVNYQVHNYLLED